MGSLVCWLCPVLFQLEKCKWLDNHERCESKEYVFTWLNKIDDLKTRGKVTSKSPLKTPARPPTPSSPPPPAKWRHFSLQREMRPSLD